MYKLERFEDGGACVVNANEYDEPYRATFTAASQEEAEQIVVDLNREVLTRRLAEHRYTVEAAGITLPDGLQLLTDRENRGQLWDSYESLKHGLIPDTDWKAVNGWQRVDLAQMEVLAKALAAHIRACYRGERTVLTAISEAATIEATEAVDIVAAFAAAYTTAYDEVMGVTA